MLQGLPFAVKPAPNVTDFEPEDSDLPDEVPPEVIETAVVALTDDGTRLDRFLASQFPALSRSRLKTLIEKGRVFRGEVRATDPSSAVRSGQQFHVALPMPAPTTAQPEPIPLTILFEDPHVLVINKPAGLACHPAPGTPSGTLVNAVLHHCGPDLLAVGAPGRPGIVHRLDKDTSGVMVVAKSDLALHSLGKQFAARSITRRYLAICVGGPKPNTGRIETRLGRDPHDRKRMAVLRDDVGSGKLAITNYESLQSFGPGLDGRAGPAASLVACKLETGRTHQIRVHLAHLGAPLIGDGSYGDNRFARGLDKALLARGIERASLLARHALHAEHLGFTHPYTSAPLHFTTPLPADMSSLLAALSEAW